MQDEIVNHNNKLVVKYYIVIISLTASMTHLCFRMKLESFVYYCHNGIPYEAFLQFKKKKKFFTNCKPCFLEFTKVQVVSDCKLPLNNIQGHFYDNVLNMKRMDRGIQAQFKNIGNISLTTHLFKLRKNQPK